MSKRKLGSGRTAVQTRAILLSEETQGKIVSFFRVPQDEVCHLSEPRGAFFQIGHALSLHDDLVDMIDLAPTASDYVAEADKIIKACVEFDGMLNRMTQRMRDEIGAEGPMAEDQSVYDPIEILPPEIYKLMDLCVFVRQKYLAEQVRERGTTTKAGNSSGPKKKEALRLIVQDLRRIFRENYRGLKAKRARRGAIKKLATYEVDEIKFVEIALSAGGIRYSNIRRYFDDDNN